MFQQRRGGTSASAVDIFNLRYVSLYILLHRGQFYTSTCISPNQTKIYNYSKKKSFIVATEKLRHYFFFKISCKLSY